MFCSIKMAPKRTASAVSGALKRARAAAKPATDEAAAVTAPATGAAANPAPDEVAAVTAPATDPAPAAAATAPLAAVPAGGFRCVCWNVNGLRSVLKNHAATLHALVAATTPDLICMQETKIQEGNIAELAEMLPGLGDRCICLL